MKRDFLFFLGNKNPEKNPYILENENAKYSKLLIFQKRTFELKKILLYPLPPLLKCFLYSGNGTF